MVNRCFVDCFYCNDFFPCRCCPWFTRIYFLLWFLCQSVLLVQEGDLSALLLGVDWNALGNSPEPFRSSTSPSLAADQKEKQMRERQKTIRIVVWVTIRMKVSISLNSQNRKKEKFGWLLCLTHPHFQPPFYRTQYIYPSNPPPSLAAVMTICSIRSSPHTHVLEEERFFGDDFFFLFQLCSCH